MNAPVQIMEPDPAVVGQDWANDEQTWETLNREAFGNRDFRPITTKAMYVLGVAHSICTSVSVLLEGPVEATYLPAYGAFASAVDLLGRCVQGNPTPYTAPQRGVPSDLEQGFHWLADSFYRGQAPNHIIQTSNNQYTIADLVALRHFAAHGQATMRGQLQDIDYEILDELKPLLASGLAAYWTRLQNDQNLSNNLARANVIGLRVRPVSSILTLFSRDPETGKYPSVGTIFNEFDWAV